MGTCAHTVASRREVPRRARSVDAAAPAPAETKPGLVRAPARHCGNVQRLMSHWSEDNVFVTAPLRKQEQSLELPKVQVIT